MMQRKTLIRQVMTGKPTMGCSFISTKRCEINHGRNDYGALVGDEFGRSAAERFRADLLAALFGLAYAANEVDHNSS